MKKTILPQTLIFSKNIISFFWIALFIFSFQKIDAQVSPNVVFWGKYGRNAYKAANKTMSSYQKCLANGYGQTNCEQAVGLCATYNFVSQGLPGLPAKFYKALGLFESFKPNCGDGECFQCCFTGSGCHTSFKGFPVINCNYNYGPETRPAGMALVLGGNPGDPCLFTPQTCDHLALCLSGLTPAQIAAINNDPNHVMKTQHAKDQRARHYAEDTMDYGWNNFLSNFSTGNSLVTDSMVQLYSEIKITDLFDFLVDRGHLHWQESLDSLSTFSFDTPAFAIYDTTTNQFLEGPSRWNFVKQLGLGRTLASVPNIRNRYDFVSSYIYTPSELETYVGSVGNPDSLMLTQMHPLAYYLLTENPKIQDYRLLSVPLVNEPIIPNFYAGDTLGTPPVIYTDKTLLDSNKLQLNLSIIYPGTHNTDYPFSGILYWGDGTATALGIDNYLNDTTLFHTYRDTGKYQAFTFVQNSTGLRALKFDEVNIQSNYSLNIDDVPVVNELWIHDVIVSTSLFTFTERIGFEITTGLDTIMAKLGIEATQVYNNNHSKSLDTIIVSNASLFEMDSIVIQPLLINDDQTGARTRFKFTHLKGLVYDPANDKDTVFNMPLPLSSIKLYDIYGNLRTESYLKEQDASGLKTIFIEYDTINIGKIVFPINLDSLKKYYISPVNSGGWVGNDTLYVEQRPDHFIPHELPDCGYELMNISYVPIPTGTYKSEGKIFSSGVVEVGDTVAFKAEEEITLLRDFYAKLGADFEASIMPCQPSTAQPPFNEPEQILTSNNNQGEDAVNFHSVQNMIGEEGIFLFSLPSSKNKISLCLIDMSGKQSNVIEDVVYESGNHQFIFNRAEFPAGVYKLIFTVNDEIIKIQKLILQ